MYHYYLQMIVLHLEIQANQEKNANNGLKSVDFQFNFNNL